MTQKEINKWLDNQVSDLMGNFFYYDRKEDSSVDPKTLVQLIADGKITRKQFMDSVLKHSKNEFPKETKDA